MASKRANDRRGRNSGSGPLAPQIKDIMETQCVAETGMPLRAFRDLGPDEQIRKVIGSRIQRTFSIEREAIDEEARTVTLAISSETPYERYWGVEILDHGAEAIRKERLDAGISLLVDHDHTDVVAIADNFEIGSDRKLRITARFSKSVRASEIWADVLDGIRKHASVGYMVHGMMLENESEGLRTYRVTDWEPYEGSLVSVPADPTVGVGRSHSRDNPEHTGEHHMPPINTPDDDETRRKRELEDAAIATRENERVSAILAAGDNYKDHGGPEIARSLISDKTATVDTFNARILEKMRASGNRPTPTAQPDAPAPYGSARQILHKGGQLRAFTKPLHFTDGTKMEPEEAAYRSGQWLLATIGQSARAQRWCRERGIIVDMFDERAMDMHRVMQTGVGSSGGYLVPDEMEAAVIDLRAQYGLARRLCRRRPMSGGTKSVPRRTGGVTAYFIEEDNSGATEAEKGWDNVQLNAKTCTALCLISKNLEEDAIIDVVDDMVMEQAYALITKEDQCFLIGDGTSTYGGMTGLRTLFAATAYASRHTAASGHDTFEEYDNTDLSLTQAGVADFPGMNPSWIVSKTFAEAVFGRLKRAAGGNTGGDMDRRYVYGYGGYPADTSDIMPKVVSTATTGCDALFGDFSKSSAFGDRRGIFVEVLRERYAEKLQIGILSHERFHVVNHDLGTTSVKGPVAALMGE